MKKTIRQFLSLILVLAMVCGMIPSAFAGNVKKATVGAKKLTEADYAATDLVWEQITEKENALYAKKAPQTQLTESAIEIVKASDNYVEGSLEQNGESFTWKTEEGISCHYSPRLRQQMRETTVNPDFNPNEEVPVETVSYATKGGSPSSKDVYLIEPYYGIDSSFTTQYQTEANSIASYLGGTYTLYKTTNATITNIANALASGAVVIFDSHGSTDYANGEDYTTGATTSYLCLQSGTGITTADYANNHALYAGSNGTMKYYEVDGTAIANHISGTCPNNILWMAICLGMATDGLQAPLRAKGVEVVYGYSQSVSFIGDYVFEASFWNSMKSGKTVAEAISTMKSTYGYWDYSPAILTANGYSSSYGYSTYAKAIANDAAFPIVVSSEDAYPGHGNVDNYQTVKSTYTLKSTTPVAPTITAVSNNTSYGTVSVSGNVITAKPATGCYVASAAVTSGTGTCTVSGNTITVNATTNCTVTVTFAKKTSATVTFSVPTGVTQSAMSGYVGDAITLPTPSGTPSDTSKTYTFAGWATSAVNNATTAPTLLKAGSSYTLTANTTLYAVYTYTTGASTGTTSATYNLVTSTSQLTTGSTVVIASSDYDYAMSGTQSTNNRARVAVSKSGSTLNTASGVGEFTLKAGTATGTYSFYDAANGGYLYAASSTGNYLRTEASLTANSSWKISVTSAGVATITAQGNYTRNIIRYNKTSGLFSCYSTAQSPVALYVKKTTTSGSTTGTTYYTSVINASSSTNAATLKFSVPSGVTQSAISGNVGDTVTLPTPSGVPADTSKTYTFAGWATSAVNNATTAPTLLKAGSSYKLAGDATLYAVYTYTVSTTSGSSSSAYTLVTSASQLTAGSTVVIASSDYNYAMSGTQSTNNRARVAISKSGSTLSTASGVGEFTLKAGTTTGTYSFYDAANGGYLYAASSTGNYLRTQTSLTANSSWKISVTSAGVATITAQGNYTRNIIRYNKTSGLFSCYSTAQSPVALYIKSAGTTTSTTYYTSVISGSSSSASGANTYSLVTSASGLTSGDYVLVVKAGGANKGTNTYYALTKASDGTSYLKATGADAFMGTGSAPATISVSDDTLSWTLTGNSSSFTLTSGSNVLNNSTNNLYYRTGTATNWSASYTSSSKTFKISSGSRYLGLRDDLALSSTTKNPRFRCNASATTTSYQFYLYKSNG